MMWSADTSGEGINTLFLLVAAFFLVIFSLPLLVLWLFAISEPKKEFPPQTKSLPQEKTDTPTQREHSVDDNSDTVGSPAQKKYEAYKSMRQTQPRARDYHAHTSAPRAHEPQASSGTLVLGGGVFMAKTGDGAMCSLCSTALGISRVSLHPCGHAFHSQCVFRAQKKVGPGREWPCPSCSGRNVLGALTGSETKEVRWPAVSVPTAKVRMPPSTHHRRFPGSSVKDRAPPSSPSVTPVASAAPDRSQRKNQQGIAPGRSSAFGGQLLREVVEGSDSSSSAQVLERLLSQGGNSTPGSRAFSKPSPNTAPPTDAFVTSASVSLSSLAPRSRASPGGDDRSSDSSDSEGAERTAPSRGRLDAGSSPPPSSLSSLMLTASPLEVFRWRLSACLEVAQGATEALSHTKAAAAAAAVNSSSTSSSWLSEKPWDSAGVPLQPKALFPPHLPHPADFLLPSTRQGASTTTTAELTRSEAAPEAAAALSPSVDLFPSLSLKQVSSLTTITAAATAAPPLPLEAELRVPPSPASHSSMGKEVTPAKTPVSEEGEEEDLEHLPVLSDQDSSRTEYSSGGRLASDTPAAAVAASTRPAFPSTQDVTLDSLVQSPLTPVSKSGAATAMMMPTPGFSREQESMHKMRPVEPGDLDAKHRGSIGNDASSEQLFTPSPLSRELKTRGRHHRDDVPEQRDSDMTLDQNSGVSKKTSPDSILDAPWVVSDF